MRDSGPPSSSKAAKWESAFPWAFWEAAGSEQNTFADQLALYGAQKPCSLYDTSLPPDETALPALIWWARNAARFPDLAPLARKYLTIPASSVPSERVFSKGRWIVSKRRASLSPNTVSLLMFLSCNRGHFPE
jgi:hypothetical protein